jgi:hypothetical protein
VVSTCSSFWGGVTGYSLVVADARREGGCICTLTGWSCRPTGCDDQAVATPLAQVAALKGIFVCTHMRPWSQKSLSS